MMEAAESDIEFKDGKFTVAGTDKTVGWGDVTLNAYIAHKFTGAQLEPGLKEGAFYDPTNFTFPAGCHICEVEIDPDTGRTEIVGWTAVDDFGTLINPMIVEGQVHGGVAQGVGQALLEGAVYNNDGQLVSGSFMDYTMPRAENLPQLKVDTPPPNARPTRSASRAAARRARSRRRPRSSTQSRMRSAPRIWPCRRRPRRSGRRFARPRKCNKQQNKENSSMYAFKYHRPTTVRQAANLLTKFPEAKVMAGGHSLLPVMKLRLASPSDIIDLGQVEGFSSIELKGRSLVIGGGTTHFTVANSPIVKESLPVLAKLAGRDRRSGGAPSRHHRRLARQQRSERRLSGGVSRSWRDRHHQQAPHRRGRILPGMFTTALEPNEIIVKVSFPLAKKAAYQKFKHPASGFALVGVFVAKRGSDIRVAVTGAGSNGVFRVTTFEEALKKRFSPKSIEGMSVPADGMNTDIHASAEYRAHLVGVLARRALADAK